MSEIAEPGFEAELKAAIEGGHSQAEFALAQHKAAKDRGITLTGIKKDSTKVVHAGAPNEGAKSAEIKAGWDKAAAKVSSALKVAAKK